MGSIGTFKAIALLSLFCYSPANGQGTGVGSVSNSISISPNLSSRSTAPSLKTSQKSIISSGNISLPTNSITSSRDTILPSSEISISATVVVTDSNSTSRSTTFESTITSQQGISASPGFSSTTVLPPTTQSPISSEPTSSPTSSPSTDPRSSTQGSQTSTFPTPPPDVTFTGDTGIITLGPQISTETGDFLSMQTGIPGLTTDSATQTSRDGHNTILPIWFLAGGIGIIKLPPVGLPVGGIIPPPPGFPPLFIGSDGKPTAGGPPEGTKDSQTSSTDGPSSNNPTSTETTTTSSTCSASTVSSCVRTCTPTTDVTGSSTVSCGEPSCAATSGCSATATTSTTTLASPSCTSSCSSCLNYQGDGETVAADNGGNDEDETAAGDTQSGSRKRSVLPPSVAGRIPLPIPLEKRADDFDKFNDGTPNLCQLSTKLKIPNYPTPGKLPGKASAGAQFWWVMKETTAPNTCPVLDYEQVSDVAVTSEKINPADAKSYTKGGDWSRTSPTVNVDHVYELSILKQFFSSRITAANCAEFKKFFDAPDQGTPQVAGDTRLQTIWRQLPSNTNPDFAGMDAKINAIKAQAFSNAFSNPSGSDNSLGYLYQLALAFKLTNDPLVSPLFKKTNDRIYSALLAMDAIINTANCGSTTTPIIQGDWASSYETWIKDLLTSAGTNVNNKVSSILNDNSRLGPSAQVGPGSTTGADGRATATVNSIGRGVAAFLNAYPTPNAFTFDVGNLITFNQANTLNIKRQACTKPPASEGSSVSASSSLQTSVPPTSSVQTFVTPDPSSLSSRVVPTSTTSPTPATSSEPPSVSSSTAPGPTECPVGCECFKDANGVCACLCS
ncbi:hypothetical protein EAF04_000791 [Stromatinia cepivora]|nr:hypothetical protein EAF04_000791 [Stromatinia cepivora]